MGPVSVFDLVVMMGYLGWPGLLVGAFGGAVIGRGHRLGWGIGLAVVGLVVCVAARMAMGV